MVLFFDLFVLNQPGNCRNIRVMKDTLPGLLVLLLLAAPAAVQSQIEYAINADGNSITITNYTGSGGDVTFPSKINGLPVTSIRGSIIPLTGGAGPAYIKIKSAFSGCSNLTGVTIPSSVTSIGDGAFDECTNLTSIRIPDSVTNIGSSAFGNCTSLTSVTIPDSVTSLGKNAFFDCVRLTSVTVPNSVTKIGNWAFSECHGLTNAALGNGVTSLGIDSYGMFRRCTRLRAVCFKGNAPSIARSARVFDGDDDAIVYYLPATTGWGPTFGGRPTKVWER